MRGAAFTAHGLAAWRRRCETAGFAAFLLKPTGIDEILAAVAGASGGCPSADGLEVAARSTPAPR